MGNTLSCCLFPNANCKWGLRSRSAKSDYQSEVYEVAPQNTMAIAPSPAALEPAKLDFKAGEGNHVQQQIRNLEMPKGREKEKTNHERTAQLTQKYSSCSTIFLDDSTVRQPSLERTINSVSLAIYYIIKNRAGNRSLNIFEERSHPLTQEEVPEEDPEPKLIYRFFLALCSVITLTGRSVIMSWIYLERFVTYTEIDICPMNWKRIVLGAMLASTVWDSKAVWNVDDCEMLKDISLEDMKFLKIKRKFLKLLRGHLSFGRSVYTRYYFDDYSLTYDDMVFMYAPLSKERAQELEAISGLCQDDDYNDLCRAVMSRSFSADDVIAFQRYNAILP